MEDKEVMRRDVFPAEVVMPGGSVLTGVRVMVTSHRLLVYKEGPLSQGRRTCQLVVGEDLEEVDAVPLEHNTLTRPLAVKDHLGNAYTVNKGRGCGCGSPLKILAPAAPWRRRG